MRSSALGRWLARLQGPWPLAWEALYVAACGAAQTLVYGAFSAWWLPLLALWALHGRLRAASPRRAAVLGWCYGTAWLAAGTWWLYISLHRYGGLAAPLALLAVLALAAALSLYLAAACAAQARWRRHSAWDVALFAALFVLAELARGVIFTGFPWLAVGYAQLDGPYAVFAPWIGVYGIGALLAASAAALSPTALPSRAAWPVGVLVVLMVAVRFVPQGYTRPAGDLSVALLQTNVQQDDKFAPERMPDALAWVARELLVARADLVLTPETAVPLLPDQLAEFAPGYWDTLVQHFQAGGPRALVGVPLGDFARGYTNSVVGLPATGPGYRYDKTHLVPFGEFIPTGFHWFTQLMNIPLGDFARGLPNPPSFAVKGQRVAPNICYEDLFGEELARRFIDPAQAPTVFANISNIAWFGPSAINAQHLNISRMRTLEFQLPMIRATNTGATAAIDHQGHVQALLAADTRGVLTALVQGRAGVTPYAWWSARFGLGPLWLLAALVVAMAVWLPLRQPEAGARYG